MADLPQARSRVDEPESRESVERVRQRFARGWGRIGAAWGVAPSTAAVHGYLLLHGGPLTEAEIREALGLSPRASRVALADCEMWGIVERSPERRRSGRRGPAGAAWVPVTDHWEWFKRVAAARKQREADPVIPVLNECLSAISAVGDQPGGSELRERLESLLTFIDQFDRVVTVGLRVDSAALATLFAAASRLDERTLERAVPLLGAMSEEDLAKAATTLSRLSPRTLRRLVVLAGQPGIAALMSRL